MDRMDLEYIRNALDSAATDMEPNVEDILRALEIVTLELEENGDVEQATESSDDDDTAEVVAEDTPAEADAE